MGARVFVFDIDGVVRSFRPARMAARLDAELRLAPDIIEQVAFAPPFGRDLVEGRLTRAQWVEKLTEKLTDMTHNASAVASIVTEWASDIGQLIPDTIELIDELRTEHPVFALTNGTDQTLRELTEHDVAHRFTGILNSYDFGIAKPEIEVYRRAHAQIEDALAERIAPASVHFADDLDENIRAAQAFGWQGTRYTDAAALRRALGAVTAS
ncbi:HAD family hydrolase [Paramicrobacterium sp. CJ85]|uniref:HAD family hydrolase n=1 Tax=Paramicrobacterium sp. CJ85 TaxID=3445355 RepID=UPI003F6069DC